MLHSLLASLAALICLQEPAPPAPPTPPAPPPQISVPPAPPSVDQPVGTIREHRGYESVDYVRRLEDVLDLDLDVVDYDAPVVATVNGAPVSRDDFLLWLAFTGGQNGVKSAQLEVLSNQLLAKLKAEGLSDEELAKYEVADADIDARLRYEEEQARAQGEAALAEYLRLIEETLGGGRYRELIRANLRVERILLPPIKPLVEGAPPQNLPLEAAELLDDQPQLRDHLNNFYQQGNDLGALFRTQFLLMLQEALINRADIVFATEHPLPAGVYMTINGEEVPTAKILAFVPDAPDSRELALRMLLLYRSIDDELAKSGGKLSNEEFELRFQAHEAEFKGTLFPLPNMIRLRGFLTIPEYREFYRRRIAFEDLAEPSEDVLKAHHEKFGKFFYENGKVSAEVLWASLSEQEEQAGGDLVKAWAAARDRAESMLAELAAGKSIADVRAEFKSVYPIEPSGTLLAKNRTELRNYLGESEYSIFINGYSVADDMFYNRVENENVGPIKSNRTVLAGMRSRMGYLVVRPIEFKMSQSLKPFDVQRPFVTQDYFDLNFTYFGHECLKNADIVLTKKDA
jgi:hypothetical protein